LEPGDRRHPVRLRRECGEAHLLPAHQARSSPCRRREPSRHGRAALSRDRGPGMTTTTARATPPQGGAALPPAPARRPSPSPGPRRAGDADGARRRGAGARPDGSGGPRGGRMGDEPRFLRGPATTELGQAESLTLTTDVADIRVIHSDQAEGVAVALVPEGAT